MVLSHTGGLNVRGYHGIFNPGFKYPDLIESLSGYEGSDGGLSVVREPGTEMVYSSGGYTLLQLLIEEVSGMAFEKFMDESIFKPLGMNSTGYSWRGKFQNKKIAVPYNAEKKAQPYYPGPELGSGGCYTTATDLAKFVALVYVNNPPLILSRSGINEMTIPAKNTNDQYGLGYKIFPVSDTLHLLAHDGANEGWRAQFMIDSKSGDGVVALINSDEGGKIMAPVICAVFFGSKVDMSPLCNSLK
jgi:CubicO group peptidase (beta-lactamase class C family)